jgi:hypothetical protein
MEKEKTKMKGKEKKGVDTRNQDTMILFLG